MLKISLRLDKIEGFFASIFLGLLFLFIAFFLAQSIYAKFTFMNIKNNAHTQVVNITGKNSVSGKNKTFFTAHLIVPGSGEKFALNSGISAGHNAPISRANHIVGDMVDIIYNPDNFTQVYEDTFWSVWGKHLLLIVILGFSFCMFISVFISENNSLFKKKISSK